MTSQWSNLAFAKINKKYKLLGASKTPLNTCTISDVLLNEQGGAGVSCILHSQHFN